MAVNSVAGSGSSVISVGPEREEIGGGTEAPPASPVVADAFAPSAPVLVAGLADAPPQPPSDPTLPTMRIGPGGVLVAPPSVLPFDGVGQTYAAEFLRIALNPDTATTLDIRGSKNKVESAPVVGPQGNVIRTQGNVILGGDNNSGNFALPGTIVVKSGDHNTWVISPPADNTFDEKAPPKNVILEGKASDWSAKYTVAPLGPRDPVVGLPLHVPNTVTYTNAKTGTSVELRGEPGTGSPRQVAFVESTKQLEALLRSNPASSPTKILEASGFKLPTGEVKAYIDWQRVQVDSPLDRLVGQGWTADGINPYTDARIIENATAEVSARAATGNTGTAPWLKPGATVARVLPPGASYDGFGNVVRKYASGGYAVFEYAPHNVNANGAPVVSQQMFRGKVFHRTFSDGSEEWDTKGVPVSLLGPGAPAASTAAPVQRATVSAPRTTERELDQTIDSLFPSMNTQQKKEFKKMLMGLMKLLNRQSLADGQALAKLLKGELRS